MPALALLTGAVLGVVAAGLFELLRYSQRCEWRAKKR